MSGWREQKKAMNRSRLASAAVNLLLTQGDEATTVAAIANLADVSTRTFHNYFARREDAFMEFLHEVIDDWADAVRAAPAEIPLLEVMKNVYVDVIGRPNDAEDSPHSLMMVAQHVAMVRAPADRSQAFCLLSPLEGAIAERCPHLSPFEVSLFLDTVFAAIGSALRFSIAEFGEDSPEVTAATEARMDEAFARVAAGFGDLV